MRTMPLLYGMAMVSLVMAGSCASAPPPFVDRMTAIAGNGDLQASITAMSAGQLWDEADKLEFVLGPEQERECDDGYCVGRVDAVANQKPGPSNVSVNGTIVGRIVNRGKWNGWNNQGREKRYKTAFVRGNSEGFFLVAHKTDTGWGWTLRYAQRNAYDKPAELVDSGEWRDCQRHIERPGHPKGKSEFASCPHPDNGDATIQRYTVRDPGWLDCEMGCCTAGY